ncbi:hypothetical protein LTR66_011064 [Elasticomyces elasticus]|nr:hypothetical protein LTR66_011064 [Elasticomyces elasticus]KAK5010634.1 hypothetical protein LTR28_008596 [Elasticomyces elasticus]
MQYSLALLALVGAAFASPNPQAVTSAVAPKASAPAGCSMNHSGTFQISTVNVSSASMTKRQDSALTLTLSSGVLTDSKGRIGYIASNRQFQFDGPPQAGAIYTAGWSYCSNGNNNTLALGSSAVFYQCLSGNFYNLYDQSTGKQCSQVYLAILSSASVTQSSDGQPAAKSGASQLSDGQVTASPRASQLSDGQVTASAVSRLPTASPVTQISDGQIQATTAKPVTQISDGQIQATRPTSSASARPVTQISDGQIQATTGRPVTQISDGQIQATTGSGSMTARASTTSSRAANGTVSTASPVAFTGAAVPAAFAQLGALGAAVLGAVVLL